MDRKDREIQELKREIRKAKEDNRYKKIGLILEAIATIATLLSLLKD